MAERTSRSIAAKSLILLASAVIGGTMATAGFAAEHEASVAATTPIKHVVVIFQENVSFDHYFATYPNAANPQPHQSLYVDFVTTDGAHPVSSTSQVGLAAINSTLNAPTNSTVCQGFGRP